MGTSCSWALGEKPPGDTGTLSAVIFLACPSVASLILEVEGGQTVIPGPAFSSLKTQGWNWTTDHIAPTGAFY